MWGALSDERTGLSVTILTKFSWCPRYTTLAWTAYNTQLPKFLYYCVRIHCQWDVFIQPRSGSLFWLHYSDHFSRHTTIPALVGNRVPVILAYQSLFLPWAILWLFQYPEHIVSRRVVGLPMKYKLERICKETDVAQSRYYPSIRWRGLENLWETSFTTTDAFSHIAKKHFPNTRAQPYHKNNPFGLWFDSLRTVHRNVSEGNESENRIGQVHVCRKSMQHWCQSREVVKSDEREKRK
jgi:hypothetical protein